MGKQIHFVVVTDDNGWSDGCNDYWGTFFGRMGPELVHTDKRKAAKAARDLRRTFDDDGRGKPAYGVVTLDADAAADVDSVRDATGYRGGFNADDLRFILYGR